MMLFTVAEHHRNLKIFTLFGPITQKRDFGQKKCIHVKLFKKGQKTYRNHKKYNFFLYHATYFFALLPKTDHGSDHVPNFFLITIDSRKCLSKETLWRFTFQLNLG